LPSTLLSIRADATGASGCRLAASTSHASAWLLPFARPPLKEREGRHHGRLDRLRGHWLASRPAPSAPPTDVRPIVQRLDALEAMLEALRDAMDRQATRHDERLNELAARLQPSELARVLSEDAHPRGL
jgi:hypothetical protein